MSNLNELYDDLDIAEVMTEKERLGQPAGAATKGYLENFVAMPKKDGFVLLRLLPPGKGKKFYCATRTHKVNGRSIHCPRILVRKDDGTQRWVDEDPKQPCVICKFYNDLYREADELEDQGKLEEAEAKRDEAKEIKPIERYYYNAIVRMETDEKGDVHRNVGPKIFSTNKTVHYKIIRAITGDEKYGEKPLGNIAAIKDGRDLRVVVQLRPGKDEWPNYDLTRFEEPSPLGEPDEVQKWLSNLHDLAALRKLIPAEEMKIQLKKHLKLIPNDDTGFDLSEFKRPASHQSLEDQVKAAQASKAAPRVPPKDEPKPAPAGEPIDEGSFLAELEEIRKLAE